ncbi:resuscitation-promoting factor protein RpfA [Actinoplanes couchii]|uniref:Transglycosylase n=1 Tax=Actinoplanes couchii TaxID=403638 RepID=A0ABQ3XHI7_9ACTN|nr:transglycosylase [Actinoplanes couchii]
MRLALTMVTAGITGAGIVLSGASPASAAARQVNWDVVAKCESGGRWNINTGNGYYGGLQFSRSTWKSNGGGKYASTADKASKAEQITIANKIHAKRGLSPWPTCGKKKGVYKKVTAKKPSASKPSTAKTYVVRSGDTLASIAKKHKINGGWRTLFALNKSILDSPSQIFPGQRIKL